MKYTAQVFAGAQGRHALLVVVPDASWPGMRKLLDKAAMKHNNFLTLDVTLPHRPRTTGPKSQSAHLHGHLAQLAIHFGYTAQEMKEIMKDDVPEWPTEERRIGKRVRVRPVSEADVSVEVESRAIEWTHMIAGEEGLQLKEG